MLLILLNLTNVVICLPKKQRKRLNTVKWFGNKAYAFGGINETKTQAKERAERYRARGFQARVVKVSARTTGSAIAHYPHPSRKISVTLYKVYVRKSRRKK